MKSFIFIVFIGYSMNLFAGQISCGSYFENMLVRGFSADPAVLREVAQIVSQSSIRTKIERVKGFNNTVIQKNAPRLEKVVRQETPYTVSLMGRQLVQEISEPNEFSQIGFVVGDPHFGNSNSQANVFRGRDIDRNRYSIDDLDEVTVGAFYLDLARASIFLKASFGDLAKKFGARFENEFFANYVRGLRQDLAVKPPAFIQKALDATPEEIREKVDKYALSRIEKDGTFKKKLISDGDLLEFTTKNMKPQFLEKMGFDRDKGDRKAFKEAISAKLTKAAQSELGENVKVVDISIPFRDSGGSADSQRFLLSTEVNFEGKTYRMILEFKENSDMSAWNAVIETPFQSAAERYAMGLKVTTDDGGPFLKVVELTPKVSFLMRPKGNIDIEFKTDAELRELALFNVYTQGLFHGGQQTDQSRSYVNAVTNKLPQFTELVLEKAQEVLQELADKSKLKPPKQK